MLDSAKRETNTKTAGLNHLPIPEAEVKTPRRKNEGSEAIRAIVMVEFIPPSAFSNHIAMMHPHDAPNRSAPYKVPLALP